MLRNANPGAAPMRMAMKVMAVLLLALVVAAPASALGKRKKSSQLDLLQLSYAAAIRWGEFEQAWEMVDPAYRAAHPMSETQFERYQQVQVSGYSDRTTSIAPDGSVVRLMELRVINKHTMAERTLRYQEQWRWDETTKRWWLVVGLPDLWDGE